MKYFEIFNKVLLELNLTPVDEFENIYKNEHLRILSNINRVNYEVLTSYNWDFLFREEIIGKETGENGFIFDLKGRAHRVFQDGKELVFHNQFADFFSGEAPKNAYGLALGKLLLHRDNDGGDLKVYYFSENCAKNAQGEEKRALEFKDDVSVIPSQYAQNILVYGACVKTKANPSHVRFPYWNREYNKAVADFRANLGDSTRGDTKIVLEGRAGRI